MHRFYGHYAQVVAEIDGERGRERETRAHERQRNTKREREMVREQRWRNEMNVAHSTSRETRLKSVREKERETLISYLKASG